MWRRLCSWYCSRVGHVRVPYGQGFVKCSRCGHVRRRHPAPSDPSGLLLQEYRDEVDPDPM